MYSLHAQRVYSGHENIVDFEAALAAEPARAAGRSIPPGAKLVDGLQYRRVYRYTDQVRRYFAVFGRCRVYVALFEDLVTNPQEFYRNVTHFLGIPEGGPTSFRAYNASKRPRIYALNRFVKSPPALVRRLAGQFLSRDVKAKIARRLLSRNVIRQKKPPLSSILRRHLQCEFAPQVEELEVLLGRSLDVWRRAQ
jgi:hypothetical protein